MGEQPAQALDAESQAVYRCFGGSGQLLYIGTTGNLGRRLAAHAQKIWFLEVRGITLEWYPDEETAEAAERRAIRIEQPKYNVVHKNAQLNSLGTRHRVHRAAPAARTSEPAVLPISARITVAECKQRFAQALRDAPPVGVSPQQLRAVSMLGSSLTYLLLAELVKLGAVTRLGHGRYRGVPGRDVAAAMDLYYKQRANLESLISAHQSHPSHHV